MQTKPQKDYLNSHYKLKFAFRFEGEPPSFSEPSFFGFMPEGGVNLNVTTNYTQAFKMGGGKLGSAIQELTGGNLTTQTLAGAAHQWTGTDPLQINLSFQLVAFDDAGKEVGKPSLTLLAVCSPQKDTVTDGFTLTAPQDALDKAIVKVGNRLTFSQIIPQTVDVNWSQTVTPEGWPVMAEVEFNFIAMNVPNRSDLDQIVSL